MNILAPVIMGSLLIIRKNGSWGDRAGVKTCPKQFFSTNTRTGPPLFLGNITIYEFLWTY